MATRTNMPISPAQLITNIQNSALWPDCPLGIGALLAIKAAGLKFENMPSGEGGDKDGSLSRHDLGYRRQPLPIRCGKKAEREDGLRRNQDLEDMGGGAFIGQASIPAGHDRDEDKDKGLDCQDNCCSRGNQVDLLA